MKRLVVLTALFLSGILVGCGTNVIPSASRIPSSKVPATSTKAKKGLTRAFSIPLVLLPLSFRSCGKIFI